MNNTTLSNFNRNVPSLELSMNFDVDAVILEDGKVRLVYNSVERMNLSTVLSAYSSKGRKPVLDRITAPFVDLNSCLHTIPKTCPTTPRRRSCGFEDPLYRRDKDRIQSKPVYLCLAKICGKEPEEAHG